jgi:hypothetical protein
MTGIMVSALAWGEAVALAELWVLCIEWLAQAGWRFPECRTASTLCW